MIEKILAPGGCDFLVLTPQCLGFRLSSVFHGFPVTGRLRWHSGASSSSSAATAAWTAPSIGGSESAMPWQWCSGSTWSRATALLKHCFREKKRLSWMLFRDSNKGDRYFFQLRDTLTRPCRPTAGRSWESPVGRPLNVAGLSFHTLRMPLVAPLLLSQRNGFRRQTDESLTHLFWLTGQSFSL